VEPTDEPQSAMITWTDYRVALPKLAELSGLDYLTGVAAGTIPPPPMAALVGVRIMAIAPGEIEMVCTPTGAHYNPLGMVHGGVVCTLLDTVVGCATHTTLPAGTGYTSVDLNVSYLRPIQAGQELRAVGTVVKPGSRITFAKGEVRDADDKLVATATSSLLIMKLGG
jgi:uncharacterized protein (TIGR00369 family)